MSSWDDVWARRQLGPSRASTLARLMVADGLDTPFGTVDEQAWTAFVDRCAQRLGLRAGSSVLEVGCGAGAFLYELDRRGIAVAGIDRSPGLVEIARTALPSGTFAVCDAAALGPQLRADVVLSCGVFMYFPDFGYARRVLEAMVRSARRAVAVLDVPDASSRAAAIAERVAALGGAERYAARYTGLEHLYFERGWMTETFCELGLVDIEVADQDVSGYANAHHRFNAFGRLSGGGEGGR